MRRFLSPEWSPAAAECYVDCGRTKLLVVFIFLCNEPQRGMMMMIKQKMKGTSVSSNVVSLDGWPGLYLLDVRR